MKIINNIYQIMSELSDYKEITIPCEWKPLHTIQTSQRVLQEYCDNENLSRLYPLDKNKIKENCQKNGWESFEISFLEPNGETSEVHLSGFIDNNVITDIYVYWG